MQNDEQQIRDLVSTWMAATQSGDVETVLKLMAKDVVFLVPGQPVVRKAEFAAAAKAQAAGRAPKSAGHTLSVLKKEEGRWVLARDANLLAPMP